MKQETNNHGAIVRIKRGLAMSLTGFVLVVAFLAPVSAQDVGTPGFWLNHSDPFSKHYAETWDLIGGAEAKFFYTGDTWLDILKTPPRGNAYLILAHQYIAAQLNVISLAGETSFAQSLTATNVSSIDLIVDHARSLCEINTANSALLNTSNSDSEGLELELVRSGVRQDFINTAFVLDEFNNALSEAREALDD